MKIDMEKIGLGPREMQVLRATIWARTQVPNGYYLCSTGENKAAERMISRGFLTKVGAEFSPPASDWLVVVLTKENCATLRAVESAALPSDIDS